MYGPSIEHMHELEYFLWGRQYKSRSLVERTDEEVIADRMQEFNEEFDLLYKMKIQPAMEAFQERIHEYGHKCKISKLDDKKGRIIIMTFVDNGIDWKNRPYDPPSLEIIVDADKEFISVSWRNIPPGWNTIDTDVKNSTWGKFRITKFSNEFVGTMLVEFMKAVLLFSHPQWYDNDNWTIE